MRILKKCFVTLLTVSMMASPVYASTYQQETTKIAENIYQKKSTQNFDLDISQYHFKSSNKTVINDVYTKLYRLNFASACPDVWFSRYNGEYKTVSLSGLSEEDYKKEIEFQEKCQDIVNSLTGSEEEKINQIVNVIMDNCEYDFTFTNYSAYNCLIDGCAVCEGYADTFYHLCEEAGITCEVVSGKANNDEMIGAHSWNRVWVNDQWFYFDITWEDFYHDGRYLWMNESDIENTHFAEEYIS